MLRIQVSGLKGQGETKIKYGIYFYRLPSTVIISSTNGFFTVLS